MGEAGRWKGYVIISYAHAHWRSMIIRKTCPSLHLIPAFNYYFVSLKILCTVTDPATGAFAKTILPRCGRKLNYTT